MLKQWIMPYNLEIELRHRSGNQECWGPGGPKGRFAFHRRPTLPPHSSVVISKNEAGTIRMGASRPQTVVQPRSARRI